MTAKKKAAAKRRPAKKKTASKRATGSQAVESPAAAAAPKKKSGGRKGLVVGLVFVAVLAVVAAQIVSVSNKKAAQKIELVRQGGVIPKGSVDGHCGGARGIAVGPDGSWYHLDEVAPNWRIQKFGADMAFVKTYKPSKAEGVLRQPWHLATGHDGKLYIADRPNRVVILDKDLEFVAAWETPLKQVSATAVDKAGRVFAVDSIGRRVGILNPEGRLQGYLGPDKGTEAITGPVSVVADIEDNIYVLEELGGKVRVRSFNSAGASKDTFFVDVRLTLYSAMGVDSFKRLYFSTLIEASGVQIYAADGDYVGAAKASTDGQKFADQGYLGVNRFGNEVIINYVNAVGKFIFDPNAKKK